MSSVLADIDPNKRPPTPSKTKLVLCSDDEDDYDTAIGIKHRTTKKKQQLYFDDDEEEEDDYDDSNDEDEEEDKDENFLSPMKNNENVKRKDHPDSIIKSKSNNDKSVKSAAGRNTNKNNSMNKKKTPNPKPRKRRRSSARFLRLSGRFEEDKNNNGTGNDGDDDDDGINNISTGGLLDCETEEEKQEKLGEMYRQAIRLNAENKINVGNSWGLNLIDNIDKFLGDEDDDDLVMASTSTTTSKHKNTVQNNNHEKEDAGGVKRVNFTRASCTLDASVKIYSYRVDDVHLTSYRVLANLNRTDNGSKDKKRSNSFGDELDDVNDSGMMSGEGDVNGSKSNGGKRTSVVTIESNLSNINVSKLDAAYDIDPIFHKMSQKFDEGGAKGLLLVNLGVASDGCRMILDSKEDNTDEDENEPQGEDDVDKDLRMEDNESNESPNCIEEGMVDISDICSKLQELLLCSPLESIQLVPQLEELRDTYNALEEEGYTDKSKVQKLTSKRYANDESEEKAAEESIHREAFERSRRVSGILSQTPNISVFTNNASDDQYAPDDYDGGFDDDDHDDDQAFDNFIATNSPNEGEKYSSTSFLENEIHDNEFQPFSSEENTNTNTVFLDAVCDGDVLNNNGEYNYFDEQKMESIIGGNQWAGCAHWKKTGRVRSKPKRFDTSQKEPTKEKDQKRKKRKEIMKDSKSKSLIDLNSCHECLDKLLNSNKKNTRGGKKNNADSSQFTQAVIQKYSKERNILPQDANIGLKQFSTLFMRPDTTIAELKSGSNQQVARKSVVGFLGTDAMEYDDGVDDSYDNGPGFELANEDGDDGYFAEKDDFVVQDLEDVRKVDKVRVKHATVAKKVDVKRLKKELWDELDTRTASSTNNKQIYDHKDEAKKEDEELYVDSESINAEMVKHSDTSFKSVVDDLKVKEAQEDVSLAFYFICVLHLANEKCLKLENGEHGLNDFVISRDNEDVYDNAGI